MSLKRRAYVLTLALAALAAVIAGGQGLTALPAAAPALTIKLATFAPANSAWHKALLDMGEDWKKATQGRVTLIVFPGGTQGTDAAVVQMMRPGVDHLQAALLLQPGLAEIDDAANVLGLPFFLQSDDEMNAVFSKLEPVVAARLEAKGFRVLQWGVAGWVQIFSKKPIKTLADLKQAKLFTTAGDDRMVAWYTSNGFRPVALNLTDIPAQLKLRTGMIDAVPSPPQGALLLQFYRDAPYVLDLRLAPLAGATVITDKAWSAISPDDRTKMLAAAKTMEQRVMADAPMVDTTSIDAMKKRGLIVTKIDPADAVAFRAAADKLVASMRGGMVPADLFDLAVQARDAYRKSKNQ